MQINKTKAYLELDDDELYSLACAIDKSLIDSIRGHYNKMDDKTIEQRQEMFCEQSAVSIRTMNSFLQLCGRGKLADTFLESYDHLFEREIIQDVHPKNDPFKTSPKEMKVYGFTIPVSTSIMGKEDVIIIIATDGDIELPTGSDVKDLKTIGKHPEALTTVDIIIRTKKDEK